jgi:hypothetical protein
MTRFLPIKKDENIEDKVKENGRITLLSVIPFILVLAVILGTMTLLEWYADWRSWHEYQSPVVLRNPVYAVARKKPEILSPVVEVEDEKTKSDMEIIEQYRLAPVLKSIYFLESTSGKNDGCKDEGKFNGYGYAQSTTSWRCYDSFEDVTSRVNEWFEDRLSNNGNNLVESVCYYNTGIPHKAVCAYSENFVSVLVDYL